MMTNFIQSLTKKEIPSEMTRRQFLPGQVFQGRILKLFPNQIAEVQVGNHKLIAALEVPLSAGERYWFQVLSGEGKIHLKVLPVDEKNQNNHASLSHLLKQMNIQGTKESLELLNFFIKEELPVSKENFHSVMGLLKDSAMDKEDLAIVKEMMLRNLPMTKEVFSSISSKSESLHNLIQNLQIQLDSQSSNLSNNSLHSLLGEMTKTGQEKVDEKIISQLVKNLVNSNTDADGVSDSILKKIGLLNEKSLQQAAVRLIMGSNLNLNAEQLSSLREVLQVGKAENIENVVKNIFRGFYENLEGKQEQEFALTRNVLTLLSADGKSYKHSGIEQLPTSIMNKQEAELINKMTETIQGEESAKWENGKFVADHMRTLVGKLGIDYEGEILSLLKGNGDINAQKLEVLKASLIQLLNEQPPAQLKDASEQLLHKITGIQLLSQDLGPTQQYVMQIPLSFWKQNTDLTIQWNGRKKENGQIDPDYCRVLFYLDLEFLNEVIVDMQIQNRIMNIKIITEVEEVKQMAAPYINALKGNLDGLGYKLSNIVFHRTNEQEIEAPKKASQPYFHSSPYNGVDIKV